MTTSEVWIGTSWKMNKGLAEALVFADAIANAPEDPRIRRFVIPPFTAIRPVARRLSGSGVLVGAQTMHWAHDGAWTGEISAPMLTDCGAGIVELGHSERRTHFAETDDAVGLKTQSAVRHGLIPLICIGETAAERDAGHADAVLERQVRSALKNLDPTIKATVLLAYEPVWAIGAGGAPASPDYAADRHTRVKAIARECLGRSVPCLYGGSVTAANCADLIVRPDIDGLFIGRAAWAVTGYLDILARCVTALDRKETQ